jgi:hypothetical protein
MLFRHYSIYYFIEEFKKYEWGNIYKYKSRINE